MAPSSQWAESASVRAIAVALVSGLALLFGAMPSTAPTSGAALDGSAAAQTTGDPQSALGAANDDNHPRTAAAGSGLADRGIGSLVPFGVGPVSGHNDGEHVYALGDSITVAAHGPLAPDGSEGYAIQFRDRHAPTWSVDRSADGSGMSSQWGTTVVARQLNPDGNHVFIAAFGANDRREESGNLTAHQTAVNLAAIHHQVVPYTDTLILSSAPLHDPELDAWYSPIDEQRRWLVSIEEALEPEGIRLVKVYDAIDTIPYNGLPDDWDPAYTYDGLHPNAAGHRRIADYFWFFVSGQDHSTSVTRDGTLEIDAYYTQTLFAEPRPEWECVAVMDITTGDSLPVEWTRDGNVIVRTVEGHQYAVGPC